MNGNEREGKGTKGNVEATGGADVDPVLPTHHRKGNEKEGNGTKGKKKEGKGSFRPSATAGWIGRPRRRHALPAHRQSGHAGRSEEHTSELQSRENIV